MKKRIIFKRIIYSVIFLIVATLAIIYVWSTSIIDKTYNVPINSVQLHKDSTSIMDGKRLVAIAHCSDCHGEHFNGGLVAKIKYFGQIIAPNISKIIPTYSDGELERVIRHGVKKNGHSVFIMPSFMYYQLKEETVEKMIAYLRTIPPLDDTLNGAKTEFEFMGRIAFIRHQIIPIAEIVNHTSPGKYLPHDTTQISFGKYLVMSTCTSCHGQNLKGEPDLGPNLIIAASYPKDEFCKLLHTGIALGNRQLGLMSKVARNNLCHLTDHEMDCIYAYLKTKPTQ